MDSADLKSTTRRRVTPERVLLVFNFVVFIALIGPGNSRQLYLAEKKMGIANLIVTFLQFWFVGSTIIATMFFVRTLVSKSKTSRPTKFDWALLLGWWCVIAVFCGLAFMVGMGG